MDTSINISNFLNTYLYHIVAQRHMVRGCWPLINYSKGNQAGRIVSNIQPMSVLCISVWVLPRGINTVFLCSDTGTIRSYLWLNWMYDSLDCICLNDNISCLVTFTMIDYFSFSLIFCGNSSLIFCFIWSNSFGLIDVDVWEPVEACPKYCLVVTLAPATRTQPICTGSLMTVVSTSWRP